jgi:non-ribosomal peptide synthetase component F
LFLKEAFSSLHALTMAETPLDLLTLPALQTHVPRLLPKIDLESIDAISAARFHVWFENQAAQAPDLVALYSGEQDRSVTYREFNENANRKAHCQYQYPISFPDSPGYIRSAKDWDQKGGDCPSLSFAWI